ncbi:hypothetical protein GOP47_0021800 [Adiantum capillus-veneris]|uniref:non-specific serine/threonine protein kinase n=1 Tax=Adiantum capillus-veneris TaxID=13818 RepID=A0A9D4U868_ADICA|nr:hypothetical protein GOP47_0021800 [Adiantum capillus-veneris]
MMQLAANTAKRIWTFVSLYALYLCCSSTKAQQGFVSVDCGTAKGYTDTNGLVWISDNALDTIAGNATAVTPLEYAGVPAQFTTIRYFPGNQTKYCYVFSNKDHGVEQGSPYLVRASFWVGAALPYNTQVKNQVKFKLLIDADEWDDVSIMLPQTGREEFKEIYVIAVKQTIDVCLAGKGIGLDVPFISSLVLRPLLKDMTSAKLMFEQARGRPLTYMQRINYGAPSSETYISYQADGGGDPYDRVWKPDSREPILSTTSLVGTNVTDHPPLRVLQTAYERDDAFNLTFSLPSSRFYHFALYYAELSTNVTMPGQRVFKLQVFNASSSLFGEVTLDLFKLNNNSRFNVYMTYTKFPLYVGIQGFLNLIFTKDGNSTYGPIVCGLELLQFFDHDMSLGTDDDEVHTLRNITSVFPSLGSWSGDPCLPYAYNWLSCTSDLQPYISNISLDRYDLGGQIPAEFEKFKALVRLSLAENKFTGSIPDLRTLQYLQVLDLHGNYLTGPIPEFLAELPSLNTLILDNNNFSGEIPVKLLSKASSSGLKFSIAGNPNICDANNSQEFCKATASQEEEKNNGALVGGLAAVGAIAALAAIGALIFCVVRHKKKTVVDTNGSSQQARIQDNRESVFPHTKLFGSSSQAQEFLYSNVKAMTRNFERMIGKGGFGPVYHGVLQNGKVVAVKLLAKDSRQGEQEFINEVQLLSRVHHKNLVSLVGYCTESQLVLVYEYMANGSLFDALKGKGPDLTAWRYRLHIAVDAAEGLDYLHRGCNPSIIHRDVKSSNILLDEEFVGRISDFGISKAKQHNTTTMTGDSQMFTVVQGSVGYLDPEYAKTNIANHSIDVYAFGVVLLELITGKPPMIQHMTGTGEYQHIILWAKPYIDRGDISSLIDPIVSRDFNISSMWKVIDIAMMCVEHDRKRRPNMSEIKLELQSALSIELQSNGFDTSSTDPQTNFMDATDVCAR